MLGISPYKVGGFSVVIDYSDIRAVCPGREHSCAETTKAGRPPAVQEDESGAIGIEEQMVEIVLFVGYFAGQPPFLNSVETPVSLIFFLHSARTFRISSSKIFVFSMTISGF